MTAFRFVLSVMLVVLAASAAAQDAPASASVSATAGAPAEDKSLPPLPPLPPVGQEAFDQVKQDAAPLSPSQIRELNRIVDDTERAASAPARFVPKEVSSSVFVSLQAGTTPPVVRLFANHVTTIVFLDQLGNPLSVRAVDLGAPNYFTVTWQQQADGGTHFFTISPKTLYASGNVAITLDGVPAPITLTLVSGQREVDYRVDVRVRGIAINGLASASDLPSAVDATGLAMLGGFAPDGARTLTSNVANIQAWQLGQRFYVRLPSQYALLSPAYLGVTKGPDGTGVYEIPPTPVLAVLAGHEQSFVTLSGY